MGKTYKTLTADHLEFIHKQKIFFVATAPDEDVKNGKINLSPKGLDSIRVKSFNKIIWLNLTGSGNETAAHLSRNSSITVMFCAFEGNPLILRIYGTARAIHIDDADWEKYIPDFPDYPGPRQIIEVSIELVQTSCGFGVPLMKYEGDRDLLPKWAQSKGQQGIYEYWQEKNSISLSGQPIAVPKNFNKS